MAYINSAARKYIEQPAKNDFQVITGGRDKPIDTILPAFDINWFDEFVKDTGRKGTTQKGYTTCLNHFKAWMESNGVESPQRDDLRAYEAVLEASGLAAGTRAQYLRAVKQFFKWAADEDLYFVKTGNIHGPKIRTGHKRECVPCSAIPGILEKIDRDTIEGKRLYAMVMLMVNNGCRTIELSRLNVGDISKVEDDTIITLWGKGHDEPDQKQILLDEVKAAIDDYLNARTDKYTSKSPLFVSDSNNSTGGRIASTTISVMAKELLKRAGFDDPRFTAHSFRHTSGTAAFKAGLDLYDTQHLMRHCDPATTEIYIHTDDDRDREKRGRKAIYDYIFNNQTVTGILPELEAEIMKLTMEQQKALLEKLKGETK